MRPKFQATTVRCRIPPNPKSLSKSVSWVGLAYLIVILSAFWWGKEFLLPIVLAALISFLLRPVVSRLEHRGFPPVLAVLSVVAIAFAGIGVLLATLSVGDAWFSKFSPKISR
jgi:predicted PurR-regulated permease PerM